MPSPFPGMDPYLEDPAYWPDFHGNFLYRIRAELTRGLPARYVAEVDLYVWLEWANPERRQRLGRPDAYVADRGSNGPQTATAVLAEPTAATTTLTLPVRRRQGPRHLQITDKEHNRVVTVVEMLSPSNK